MHCIELSNSSKNPSRNTGIDDDDEITFSLLFHIVQAVTLTRPGTLQTKIKNKNRNKSLLSSGHRLSSLD